MSALNTEFQVSCSCGSTNHTFNAPLSALPFPSHLCGCDISRRISGSLLTSYINITLTPDDAKPDTSKCTAYNSSSILRRWFCSTCGTHMYLEYYADGHFEAATGTLNTKTQQGTDGLVQFESCMWIGDTKDGGASRFLSQIDGRELKRWMQGAETSDEAGLAWRVEGLPDNTATIKATKPTYAHCHCRGVEFWVTPPDDSSRLARSPFPDLQVPFHLDDHANPDNTCWWLQNDRYLAGTCACHSCRRASGFDLTFWAFIPTANIFLDELCTIPFSSSGSWGSMQTYTSSPGVTRTFCASCGANIFWQGDKDRFGRQGLIDVAVGLLDSCYGARAEDLLTWWPHRVSFAELALNQSLIQGLQRGLQAWAATNAGKPYVAHRNKP